MIPYGWMRLWVGDRNWPKTTLLPNFAMVLVDGDSKALPWRRRWQWLILPSWKQTVVFRVKAKGKGPIPRYYVGFQVGPLIKRLRVPVRFSVFAMRVGPQATRFWVAPVDESRSVLLEVEQTFDRRQLRNWRLRLKYAFRPLL
jgi:hypothetical protein